MQCVTYDLNTRGTYKYVVILSTYQGKIMLSRHRQRDTWETQGGHIEKGETPLEAAKRELYEESGAVDFDIAPAFDYWAEDDHGNSNGMVFVADIRRLGELPRSEMKEIGFFDALPDNLTYGYITPVLMARAGLID